MKALYRDQFYFSRSMSCISVLFSNRVLLSICGKKLILLGTVWVVWAFTLYPFGHQFNRCSPCLVLKASFGYEKWQFGALSLPLFGNFRWIAFKYLFPPLFVLGDCLHICNILRKLLLYWFSIPLLKCPLILCASLYFSFIFSSLLDLTVPAPMSIYNYLF